MIAVIGGGAFGTALACALARNGTEVRLWMRDGVAAMDMAKTRVNKLYLPDIILPQTVFPTANLDETQGALATLLVVPAQITAGFLHEYGADLPDAPLVLCAKGLTREGERFQSELTGSRACVTLTGPGFAGEIAAGLPTALTLAGAPDLVRELQPILSRRSLRLYRSSDQIGAELGGALKNVIAIAAGITIGAGLGESARAAVMTRGFAEMRRLAVAMGARDETLSGLSGFGDLALTCASTKSRNFAHGVALGTGGEMATTTVEGVATARAATRLAARFGVEMPIADAVAMVLENRLDVGEAMTALLSRPQGKAE